MSSAVGALVTGCLVAVAVAGCGADAGTPSGRGEDEHACVPIASGDPYVHEPEVVAVEGDGRDALPRRWTDAPTVDDVLDAARSDGTRADAEHFALLLAQRVVDTRDRTDGQRLVDALAAEELPREACVHILLRTADQFELGWGTHVSGKFPVFQRSRAEGADDAPSRVEVELLGTAELSDEPELFGDTSEVEMPLRVRVDVVRDGDVWLLADWDGPEAATGDGRTTPEGYGTGWSTWDPGA